MRARSEDVPLYTGHSLFNTTKCITLFIVPSLLHCNPASILIKSSRSLSRSSVSQEKFHDLDRCVANFALCKRVIILMRQTETELHCISFAHTLPASLGSACSYYENKNITFNFNHRYNLFPSKMVLNISYVSTKEMITV